jgi:hypothetical protein
MKLAITLLVVALVLAFLPAVWRLLKRVCAVLIAVLALTAVFTFTIGPWLAGLLLLLMLCVWWVRRRRATQPLPDTPQQVRKWSKIVVVKRFRTP